MRTVSIPMARTMALALSLTALAACAPGPQSLQTAATARQCFWGSSLTNFRQGDPGRLYIRDRSNQVFEVSTLERCQDLDHASAVALQSDYSSVGQLCVGDRARITVRGLGGEPANCRAHIDRRLTPEQIAALPDNQRP